MRGERITRRTRNNRNRTKQGRSLRRRRTRVGRGKGRGRNGIWRWDRRTIHRRRRMMMERVSSWYGGTLIRSTNKSLPWIRTRISRDVVRRRRIKGDVVRKGRVGRVRRSGSLNFNFYSTTIHIFTVHSLLGPTCTRIYYKRKDTK